MNFENSNFFLDYFKDFKKMANASNKSHYPLTYHPLLPGNYDLFCVILIQVIILLTSSSLIFIITREKNNLKNTTNKLIMNQACSDLMNGVIFVSLVVANHKCPSDTMGKAISISNVYILFVSLLSLEIMAAYRFTRVRNPLEKFRHTETSVPFIENKLPILITVIWVFPMFVGFLPLIWNSNSMIIDAAIAQRFYVGFLWLALFLLFLCLVLLNVMIYRTVMAQLKSSEKLKFNRIDRNHINKRPVRTSKYEEEPSTMQDTKDTLLTKTANTNSFKVDSEQQSHNQRYSREARIRKPATRISYGFSLGLAKYREFAKNLLIHRQEARMARLLMTLMITYIISYFPLVFINFIFVFKIPLVVPQWFQTFSLYTFILQSAINPILCISMKQDLRLTVKRLQPEWIKCCC